jgi:S-adenosylmethionine:tRNA ribosyltransferase-isomerase
VNLKDFDFTLPDELVAQHPLPQRDQSRLMVVDRSSGACEHRIFSELPEILPSDAFLVVNSTRVFPARAWARRPGKNERIEVLFIGRSRDGDWTALLRPAHKAKPGQILEVAGVTARVHSVAPSGSRLLIFDRETDVLSLLERHGETPLPPYISRNGEANRAEDRSRYQTVYARQTGSVAAPTAGLHFTPEVIHALRARGVPLWEILLHVGYGTFQPVRCEKVEDHKMASEYFEVTDEAAARISGCIGEGGRLVAVGTTTTRVLEHLAGDREALPSGKSGLCDLFIYPGYEFRIVRGLLTNFHLPKSSLFMLVCAFGGRDLMMQCYREAIARRYRFYSYGDCMLIL